MGGMLSFVSLLLASDGLLSQNSMGAPSMCVALAVSRPASEQIASLKAHASTPQTKNHAIDSHRAAFADQDCILQCHLPSLSALSCPGISRGANESRAYLLLSRKKVQHLLSCTCRCNAAPYDTKFHVYNVCILQARAVGLSFEWQCLTSLGTDLEEDVVRCAMGAQRVDADRDTMPQSSSVPEVPERGDIPCISQAIGLSPTV